MKLLLLKEQLKFWTDELDKRISVGKFREVLAAMARIDMIKRDIQGLEVLQ